MARHLRIAYEGVICHITTRKERATLFIFSGAPEYLWTDFTPLRIHPILRSSGAKYSLSLSPHPIPVVRTITELPLLGTDSFHNGPPPFRN